MYIAEYFAFPAYPRYAGLDMNWMKRVIIIFIALGLSFLVIGSIVRFYAFNLSYYQHEFERVQTYERLGEEQADADAERVIAYIKGDAGQLAGDFWTDQERAHMADVRAVLEGLRSAMGVVVVLVLLLWFVLQKLQPGEGWRQLSHILLSSGSTILFIIAVVGLFAALGFESAFTAFHGIFFDEGSWQFPDVARLIQLFPEQFFFDITLRIVIDSLLGGVVLCGLGITLWKLAYLCVNNSQKVAD